MGKNSPGTGTSKVMTLKAASMEKGRGNSMGARSLTDLGFYPRVLTNQDLRAPSKRVA